MAQLVAQVASLHVGSTNDLGKEDCDEIRVELDGIVGDRHRSLSRQTWAGDKQPEGTTRRNERQWSAMSVEELTDIQAAMDLTQALTAGGLGVNLCLSGIQQLSRLPKGTILRFPSGAELSVEEYNPPCHDMGKKLASEFTTTTGKALASTAFSKAAKLTRGIVGVVEVPGIIKKGDEVIVEVYETPAWLRRTVD